MNASERATFLLYQASKRISVTGGERPNPNDDRPATHLISGCFWPEAINEIDAAIADLKEAKAKLETLTPDLPPRKA